jgi:hypothetical protein
MHAAIPPFPNTPSWRGAQLKHRGNFTFTFKARLDADASSSGVPTRCPCELLMSQMLRSCGTDDRGSNSGRGWEFSSSPQRPDLLWGLTSLLSNEYWGLLGYKAMGREGDRSFPSRAEVGNVWSYTSTPPYLFIAW